ncbi:MAG: twin-arginine translocase subunit TatC, partial [Vicinamibacteria bacterium]
GLCFELPVVIFFLARIGLVTSATLARVRRHAIVVIVIAAAVLTPSVDLVSQSLLAGPLIVLYEASIWIARIFGRREQEEAAAAEPTA